MRQGAPPPQKNTYTGREDTGSDKTRYGGLCQLPQLFYKSISVSTSQNALPFFYTFSIFPLTILRHFFDATSLPVFSSGLHIDTGSYRSQRTVTMSL